MLLNKMKIMILTSMLVFSPLSFAQTPIVEFSTCMADTLNGKQRKEMAKWIYLSMGVHPLLQDFSVATAADRNKTDKYIGDLVTQLLTVSCPSELKKAYQADPLALQKGFEYLGQIAMMELMGNPETMSAISSYAKYIDQEAIGKILESK